MDFVVRNRANQLAATNGRLNHNPSYCGQILGDWGSADQNVAQGYLNGFRGTTNEWAQSTTVQRFWMT